MPTAVAGPDVLNDGDLLEDDVLCKKEKKEKFSEKQALSQGEGRKM
jgi:hypothetical protein